MIRINLLSPIDKENLRWEKLNKLVRQATLWTLIAEAVFATAFFSSLQYLKATEGTASEELASLRNRSDTRETAEMEAGLSSYKKKIDEIYTLQSGQLSWTYLLSDLAAQVPAGVRLKSVDVSLVVIDEKKKPSPEEKAHAGQYKISLTGNARTRADLLDLESRLKQDSLLSDLECDDSNYVNATDVDFRYGFYVRRETLLR